MFGAVVVWFFLPWLDRNPVKSIRYKGMLTKVLTMLFAADYVVLNYVGLQPPTAMYTLLSQIGTIYYFVFFFSLLFIHKFERSKPVPDRVTS